MKYRLLTVFGICLVCLLCASCGKTEEAPSERSVPRADLEVSEPSSVTESSVSEESTFSEPSDETSEVSFDETTLSEEPDSSFEETSSEEPLPPNPGIVFANTLPDGFLPGELGLTLPQRGALFAYRQTDGIRVLYYRDMNADAVKEFLSRSGLRFSENEPYSAFKSGYSVIVAFDASEKALSITILG